MVKYARYFQEQVLRKRPEITVAMVERAIMSPVRRIQQPDGRWPLWAHVPEVDKFIRVVLLDDGTTVLNAFFDRNYKENEHEV